MTVKELVEQLEKFAPNQIVVTDLHSEFSEVKVVASMVGYENGGYVSRPYSEEQRLHSHGYVFIGVS